ncbi:hypothetical protein Tco_1405055 [Tanacetum coccineum]
MHAKRVTKSLSSAYEDIAAGSEPNPTGNEDVPADTHTSIADIPTDISVTPGSTSFLTNKRLGLEAAERLQAQEQAKMDRQGEELLRQDELLARQLNQDFNMLEQQKKRQQEVQEAVMYYTKANWITIMAKIQVNAELSRTLIGSNLSEADFASTMVEMISQKRRQITEQKAKARRDRPMIQTYLSYLAQWDSTRGSKRSTAKIDQGSSKRLKPDEIEATSAPMKTKVKQVLIPSEGIRTSKESEVMKEKVESSKRTPRKWKTDARKGLHISKSTIQIEEGDLDAEHNMCLKYAFDEKDDSNCDNLASLYAVVDWELLPIGLGEINVIYRKDNSHKYFTNQREILHLVTRQDLMTIYGLVVNYYQDKKAEGVGLLLWGDLRILMDSPETVSSLVIYMFMDKKYPLTVKLMKRMLDHQLEIGQGAVGNELTTAV